MDIDEKFTMNEEARADSVERTICTSCGKYLTNAEEEDPCIIKRYFMDEWYVEDIVCDSCASEIQNLEA